MKEATLVKEGKHLMLLPDGTTLDLGKEWNKLSKLFKPYYKELKDKKRNTKG